MGSLFFCLFLSETPTGAGFDRLPADVGREKCVLFAEQRIVRSGRFDFLHVQSGSGDLAGSQCRQEILLVYQRTTGGVDSVSGNWGWTPQFAC